jgi:hypothetical protein
VDHCRDAGRLQVPECGFQIRHLQPYLEQPLAPLGQEASRR